MPRRPANVVAVTPGGNITQDMILGYYAIYQVPDAPVSASKLRKLWLPEGLEEKLVPKNRKAVDAFMSACRSVETRRTMRNGHDRTHEVKVDRVMDTTDECVYQITQLVRDEQQRVIDHPKAMRVVFNKHDESVKDEPLDRKVYRELKSLANDIRDDFERNSTKIPGAKVRAAIRATLASHHATGIQGKGIFFVPKAGKSDLDAIGRVLDGLYGENGAELHLIPCADADADRKVIAKHFEESVVERADRLQAEVTQRLKSEQLRGDRRESLVRELKQLNVAVDHYKDMLDTKLNLADEKMRLLRDSMEELLLGVAA